jgi:hypothetical protein
MPKLDMNFRALSHFYSYSTSEMLHSGGVNTRHTAVGVLKNIGQKGLVNNSLQLFHRLRVLPSVTGLDVNLMTSSLSAGTHMPEMMMLPVNDTASVTAMTS